MSINYNSADTANTINRAIDNSMGLTTTHQGASSAGLIIKEDLQPVVQCVTGFDYKITTKTITGIPPLTMHAIAQYTDQWTIDGNGIQDGTPTPDNPIDISGVGDLITEGEHAGDFIVPLLINNSSTDIYLSDVITNRRVYKYVFTGDETWVYRSGEPSNVFFTTIDGEFIDNHMLCTHYQNHDEGGFATLQDKQILILYNTSIEKTRIGIRDSTFNNGNEGADALKNFIRTLYTNNTPLIAYIVPNFAIEDNNEPLMKVGEYADTLSGETNDIDIELIWGNNTVDVDTTVAPTLMTITYKDD